VLVLEEGKLLADRHHLHVGDSTFDCRTPHRWRNPSTEQSRVLWIITPASY
jgi:hypothetical protein